MLFVFASAVRGFRSSQTASEAKPFGHLHIILRDCENAERECRAVILDIETEPDTDTEARGDAQPQ